MTQEQFTKRKKTFNDRIIFGSIVLIIGVFMVLRNIGVSFPSFLFSWPMILIAGGIFIAIRDQFRSNTWWILLALGTYFLISREFPDLGLSSIFWPAIIIAIGLSILSGNNNWFISKSKTKDTTNSETSLGAEESVDPSGTGHAAGAKKEDTVDAAAVFGVVKKNIYSKNFKGGEVATVFGGAELNLLHADFTGEIKLEIVSIFGGTTLFIPAHWQIRSEAAAIMGAIEDKRREPSGIQTDKVLVIEGFVLFGGIDIKSA